MGSGGSIIRTIFIFGIALSCVIAVTESARAINPISATRVVEANDRDICFDCDPDGPGFISMEESISSNSFGLFDENASGIRSFALQESSVSSAGISGMGRIFTGSADISNAKSSILVDFTVDSTRAVNLVGELRSDNPTLLTHVELSHASGRLFVAYASDGVGILDFDEEITLQPGTTYTLEAQSRGGGGDLEATWSVNLSVVPEPSAATLALLSTLAGVALRRR